jgi:DNA-binding HxlR family transcriptional regulator/CheY-like chemotaxis protein
MHTNGGNPSENRYGCPVEITLKRIGGKWKSVVLWWLRHHEKSFGELKQLIPGISAKVLTQQLRQLEEDGLIHRKAYREVPRRIEYSVTAMGKTLKPLTELMCEWGKTQMPEFRFGQLDLTSLGVLMVSAEPDEVLCSELASRGATVAIATSANEALQQIEQIFPQALIVDTALPDNSAYRLIQSISHQDYTFAAIALTETNSDDRRQAFRANFQVCLPKPTDPSELIAALVSLTGILKTTQL